MKTTIEVIYMPTEIATPSPWDTVYNSLYAWVCACTRERFRFGFQHLHPFR